MPRHEVTVRFYAELNDLLPARHRGKRVHVYRFFTTGTVRDAIESFDVPHTQVDLVLVNDEPAGFDRALHDGDRMAVYPVFESIDISSVTRLRPEPLRQTAFVLDVHLGRLARLLRTAGLDTFYRNDFHDDEIIRTAILEKRIILTRDKGILKHKVVTHGYWLHATDPEEQFVEVVRRFDLAERLRPFTRCTWCNEPLITVEKEKVLHRLEKKTREHFDHFMQCPVCRRIYWQGCHYERMRDRLIRLISRAQNGRKENREGNIS